MGAAVRRVNIIGKGKHQFLIAVVVLHSQFHSGISVGSLGVKMQDILVQGIQALFFVDIFHIAVKAALITEIFLHGMFPIPFVPELNMDAGV